MTMAEIIAERILALLWSVALWSNVSAYHFANLVDVN
jgi:hypothetical protein